MTLEVPDNWEDMSEEEIYEYLLEECKRQIHKFMEDLEESKNFERVVKSIMEG
jgi:hypothetical protein